MPIWRMSITDIRRTMVDVSKGKRRIVLDGLYGDVIELRATAVS